MVCPGPEAATRKGWKRRRKSLTIWINPDGDIGVNSWRGQDPITTKDWVRAQCGLPAWQPRRRTPTERRKPALAQRCQFLAESLRIVRHRHRISSRQFALIVNDLRNIADPAEFERQAIRYAREFKVTPVDLQAAMLAPWRAYSASERAAIWRTTYQEYRDLGLRRSGCAEMDPAERRRLTKERYNAKRRADRAAARASSEIPNTAAPEIQSATERSLPLPTPKIMVGTVRKVPSSEEDQRKEGCSIGGCFEERLDRTTGSFWARRRSSEFCARPRIHGCGDRLGGSRLPGLSHRAWIAVQGLARGLADVGEDGDRVAREAPLSPGSIAGRDDRDGEPQAAETDQDVLNAYRS